MAGVTTGLKADTIAKDSDWVRHSFMLSAERFSQSLNVKRLRNISSADFKFTGTSFGQNTVLNPAPGWTPSADIRKPGLWPSSINSAAGNKSVNSYFRGMGRAYSMMIDDNKQVVSIRWGVTQYRGLFSFFTGFYDNEAATLARSGRAGIGYYFGLIVGSVATLFLQPVVLLFQAVNYFFGRSSSKYMYLKPTMPLYWERAQVIMNSIGANMGIIPRTFSNTGLYKGGNDGALNPVEVAGVSNGGGGTNDISDLQAAQKSVAYQAHMYKLMPNMFKKDGRFDLQLAAGQAARRQIEWRERVANLTTAMGATNSTETYNALLDYLSRPINTPAGKSMEFVLEKYHTSALGSLAKKIYDGDTVGDLVTQSIASNNAEKNLQDLKNAAATEDPNATPPAGGNTEAEKATQGNVEAPASATADTKTDPNQPDAQPGITTADLKSKVYEKRQSEFLTTVQARDKSDITDGDRAKLQEAIATGKDIGTATGIIDRIQEVKTGWFSEAVDFWQVEWNNGTAFANFAVNYTGPGSISMQNATKNTTIEGTLKGLSGATRDARVSMSDFQTGFSFIDGAMNLARDVFGGVLDGVKLSGLMALAGNAFIDIPKQWDDSSATLPTASFTIDLRDPYGNEISNYIHLYSVLSCLLAGSAPLATGAQSYTAPFVCEAYCRGRFAIRYGMITDITIRHGEGNHGFTEEGRPRAFQIDVTIADLSSIYYAPISNGMSPINILKRVFDDDNPFNDYLSTITGVSLDDMVNPKRKLAIRLATQVANVKSWWSPSHISSRLVGSFPVQVANKIFGPSVFPNT